MACVRSSYTSGSHRVAPPAPAHAHDVWRYQIPGPQKPCDEHPQCPSPRPQPRPRLLLRLLPPPLPLGAFIILQLSLQPRNNILHPGLALFKREIPTPIPPARFLIRLQRRPLPQLRELGLAKWFGCSRVLVCMQSRVWIVGTCDTPARQPVLNAWVEFCAQELFERAGLCPARVLGPWVGD